MNLSNSAAMHLQPGHVSLSGKLKFNIIDVSDIIFDVEGGISPSIGLYVECDKYDYLSLGIASYSGWLNLYASANGISIVAKGNLCSDICCFETNAALGINTSVTPPQINIKEPFSGFFNSILSCLNNIGEAIEDAWCDFWGC
ncbi:MAG: hypothetical protein KJ737_00010 [Proteobacteria bacterium]|nr:hypothetical protein [Pseudomonadota bacterium]